MSHPTDSQLRVLSAIDRLFRRNGLPPTLAEVGDELGIGAPGVLFHVQPLRKAGLLRSFDRATARCLVPTIYGYAVLGGKREAA